MRSSETQDGQSWSTNASQSLGSSQDVFHKISCKMTTNYESSCLTWCFPIITINYPLVVAAAWKSLIKYDRHTRLPSRMQTSLKSTNEAKLSTPPTPQNSRWTSTKATSSKHLIIGTPSSISILNTSTMIVNINSKQYLVVITGILVITIIHHLSSITNCDFSTTPLPDFCPVADRAANPSAGRGWSTWEPVERSSSQNGIYINIEYFRHRLIPGLEYQLCRGFLGQLIVGSCTSSHADHVRFLLGHTIGRSRESARKCHYHIVLGVRHWKSWTQLTLDHSPSS